VTVNHNAGEALLACVTSVLASSLPVEMWVVDNASRDDSVERVVRAHGDDPRLHVLRNDVNVGFARANNQVLRNASGQYALLLNPDCVVAPDTLAAMRSVMEQRPDAGMAGCLVLGTDGREQQGCRRALPTPARSFVRAFRLTRPLTALRRRLGLSGSADFVLTGEPLPAEPVGVEAISGAFMFLRRSALERVGLLDEGYFLHCEDLDLCLRFRQAGFEVLFVPHVQAVHEKGRCSRERPLFVQWHLHRGMARFHCKHFLRSYPILLTAVVLPGVWVRFLLISVPSTLLHQLGRRSSGAGSAPPGSRP